MTEKQIEIIPSKYYVSKESYLLQREYIEAEKIKFVVLDKDKKEDPRYVKQKKPSKKNIRQMRERKASIT